ncbi:PilZ domain-containing protein [Sutcliffiella halmapala]|uniref:PilZ domain-containing protein n=1 Tax=Sutcliffiella halmapala TaxID=79882 RepID=UPI001475B2C2|nr:PilZ domain-containing protein [Sutcliffiella halmapala]
MKYKRNEPFRYEFGVPVDMNFFISRIDGKSASSSEGEGKMLDISPSGLRMQSSLNIPSNKDIELTLQITIGNQELSLIGKIVWQKKVYPSYQYGVELISEAFEEQIISALKEFQKQHRDSPSK